jgi:ribosomal-protein-alanine N-acetyltransferase
VSFVVRAMEPQDLDLVVALAAQAVEAPRWIRSDYEQLLPSPPAALLIAAPWVALVDDRLVGFVVARWLRGEPAAEIENLIVAEGYRRQGLGTALVGHCAEWAARSGASFLRLEVRASNHAAIALYRTLGFVPAGLRLAYYASPVEDAFILQAPVT